MIDDIKYVVGNCFSVTWKLNLREILRATKATGDWSNRALRRKAQQSSPMWGWRYDGKLEIRTTAAISGIDIRYTIRYTKRARIFSDDHELQRDTVKKVRRNQLPRKMRRGGERAGVQRCLRHSSDAGSSLPAGRLRFSVGVQKTKAQPDTANSGRTGFHEAE